MSYLESVIYFLGSAVLVLIVASAFLFCVLCLLNGFLKVREWLSGFVFCQRFFNIVEILYTLYFIRKSDYEKLRKMKDVMETVFDNQDTWEYKFIYGIIKKRIG